MTPIVKPAVLFHTFLAVDQVRDAGGPARACLDRLWTAAQGLGIDAAIPDLPHELAVDSVRDPGVLGVGNLVVLGARRHPDIGGVRAIVVYRRHDVIGVAVMLAPADGTWAAQAADWAAATAGVPLPAALGTATVYLGLTPEHKLLPTNPRVFAGEVAPLLSHDPAGAWTDCWTRSNDLGVLLWELPWTGGAALSRDRRLLAVTTYKSEATLDAWAWLTGGSYLAPLTVHLLHAAKVRYEYGVLARDLPHVRAAADSLAQVSKRLQGLVQGSGRDDLAALRSATGAVDDVSMKVDGVIDTHRRLRGLADTLRFARLNAGAAVEGDFEPRPGSSFRSDADLAAVLEIQVQTETAELESAAGHAREIAERARGQIDERLRDRQAGLTLAQTSVLGGLLMVLAAIQALQYTVPLPGPIQAPLILFFGSLALMLPLVVQRWRDIDRQTAGSGGVLPALAMVLTGASAGWLTASVAAGVLTHEAAAPVGSIVTALFGVAVASVSAVAWRHSRREPPSR